MSREDVSSLPVIREMPIIDQGVWDEFRGEMIEGVREKGEEYFWLLGARIVGMNPRQSEAYEYALRQPPKERDERGIPKDPDATSVTAIIILHVLDTQARKNGYRLPELPESLDPLPALRGLIPQSDRTEQGLIDVAYKILIEDNPVISKIIDSIAEGAPNQRLWALTKMQARRVAVYAYYGVKSLIPK